MTELEPSNREVGDIGGVVFFWVWLYSGRCSQFSAVLTY